MKLNESITCSFSIPMLALFLFVGCSADSDDLPKTATLKVKILPPNPLILPQPIAETSSSQPVCKAGDILRPGDSCFYPGTDTKFSIRDDGGGKFLVFNVGTGINIKNSRINGKPYTLVANKRPDGSWEIKEVGRAVGGTDGSAVRGLDLTVSTDFTVFEEATGPDRVVYHSKEEFSITQDFDRDFQLNPDAPRIAYEVFNGTPYTLSVRIILLIDGEADDGEDTHVFSPGDSLRVFRLWGSE